MRYLTILNHGTANSSENTDLVINKLSEVMGGVEDTDWILNEGAGTDKLFERADINKGKTGFLNKTKNSITGVVSGKGVEANVQRAVAFVQGQMAGGDVTVNMAGHSRGSITCYKIARALRDSPATAKVPVNIFAIDPVPGNMGTLNQENYKNIALGGNLVDTVLMLAESEHRLAFRPYVDALYSMGLSNHKLDTIPGTHGGINELAGAEKEAALIVMCRAVEFLDEHQTWFLPWADMWKLGASRKLETYAKLMKKIKKYKWHASMWNPFEMNIVSGGMQVDKHRTATVFGAKDAWGTGVAGATDAGSAARGRADHHGLRLNEALQRGSTLPGGQEVHSTRANRFFANLEHQELFCQTYPTISLDFIKLERGVSAGDLLEIRHRLPARWGVEKTRMSTKEREYGAAWLKKQGCPVSA